MSAIFALAPSSSPARPSLSDSTLASLSTSRPTSFCNDNLSAGKAVALPRDICQGRPDAVNLPCGVVALGRDPRQLSRDLRDVIPQLRPLINEAILLPRDARQGRPRAVKLLGQAVSLGRDPRELA